MNIQSIKKAVNAVAEFEKHSLQTAKAFYGEAAVNAMKDLTVAYCTAQSIKSDSPVEKALYSIAIGLKASDRDTLSAVFGSAASILRMKRIGAKQAIKDDLLWTVGYVAPIALAVIEQKCAPEEEIILHTETISDPDEIERIKAKFQGDFDA